MNWLEKFQTEKLAEVHAEYDSNERSRNSFNYSQKSIEEKKRLKIEAEDHFKGTPNCDGLVEAVVLSYKSGYATNLSESLAYIDTLKKSNYLVD